MSCYQQIRVVIIIAFITTVTACSFKTFYNQLDFLILEYVEGLVSLDDMLEEEAEERTRLLLDWHRNSQLRQYAAWFHSIQQDVGAQLTEKRVLQHINEAERFWRVLSARLNDEMAHLLPLLGKQQQAELFGNILDKNKEFREEFIDMEEGEQGEYYVERLSGIYENWLDELTEEQMSAVKRAAAGMVSTAALRLQWRQEWQRGIQKILAEQDTRQHQSMRLRQFLAGFEQMNSDAMQEKTDMNKRLISRLTVRLAHSMTDKQKTYFVNKTNKYIRMFTELAENR